MSLFDYDPLVLIGFLVLFFVVVRYFDWLLAAAFIYSLIWITVRLYKGK